VELTACGFIVKGRADSSLIRAAAYFHVIIHKKAPHASIAFNTNPFDTIDAISRWS
jgi:hypothetical protein